MPTFKYLHHRSLLKDSMNEFKEFSSKEDLLKFLKNQPLAVVSETSLTCSPYIKDERISWEEVWVIRDTVGVLGYTDKNINLFCQKSLEHKGKRVREAFLLAKFPDFKGKTSEETFKRAQFLKDLIEKEKTFVKNHSVKEIILELDKLLTNGDKDRFFYRSLFFFQTLRQTHKLNSGEMNSLDFNPASYA